MNINHRTRGLLDTAVVWDNHACMPLRADAGFLPQLERFRDAGVDVVSVNVGFDIVSWSEQVRVLSFMRHWLTKRPDTYRLISTIEDVRRSKSEHKLGVVFDIEGMEAVQDNPSLVQTFYELGVRWMLIAYNRNNAAGGGCLDNDGGLTTVGRLIIDEMERVGMVLCLSHSGARTASEALEYSRNPTIYSHTNPHGHSPHPRNVSNELMRACARKGGVVGLSGVGPFLSSRTFLVQHLLEQLRYVVDVVGAEHVGLGLDYVFDRAELDEHVRRNPALFPPDIKPSMPMIEPEAVGEIAEGLAHDNLTDAQIRGILGENWLRIATQVWR